MKYRNIYSHVLPCFMGLVLTFSLAGCQTASQQSGAYSARQIESAMRSSSGTILSVRQVQVQKDQTGIGAVGGTVLGGVTGSTIGSGRGKLLAVAGGAAAGAALGNMAEKANAVGNAVELEVELEDESVIVVVQELNDDFNPGDHVKVLEANDGTIRIRQ